ncbi:MAG: SRPBCC domain-containing protein [Pseudomonadota bacterium]
MDFQAAPGTIAWKVHFRSEPDAVYQALATDRGRSSFWAEQTVERNGEITFHFMSHPPTTGRLLAADPPSRFAVTYFGTETTFTLTDDGSGGTDLELTATAVPDAMRDEMIPGWVSVLLAMKAAVDHGVDLRNHSSERSWQTGYCDN